MAAAKYDIDIEKRFAATIELPRDSAPGPVNELMVQRVADIDCRAIVAAATASSLRDGAARQFRNHKVEIL